MIRIAVSGHRALPPATVHLLDDAIRAVLSPHAPSIVGLSCLADGADQLFARAVMDLGGSIEVIVPAKKYKEALPKHVHATYDDLIARATKVHAMPFTESTSESHMEASAYMLESVDELWAIWDGQPARGYGGTADVVTHAKSHGVPVRIVWPHGATRD